MIDGKMSLDTIDELPFIAATANTGVTDKDVDLRSQCKNGLSALHDRFRICKLQGNRRRMSYHLVTCGLGTLERTTGADHMRATQRKHTHGFEADPGGASRDNRESATQVQAGRHLLGC